MKICVFLGDFGGFQLVNCYVKGAFIESDFTLVNGFFYMFHTFTKKFMGR